MLHDVTCVVHLHSRYSDGTGTVPQIARAGRRAGADVVILTDHNTLEARERGEERWHGDVLLLVGEEVSPKGQNHYLALGVDEVVPWRDVSPEQICRSVREAGGFGFAAHPFSRGSERFRRGRAMPFRGLDCDALHGVELWSFATDTAESLPSIPAALRFIAMPGRVLDHPPEENVRGWERLCAERRTVAIGGDDAHQFGITVGSFTPLRLMSYRRSFRHIRTHALVDEPLTGDLDRDRELVFSALRVGRCYIAVDSVSPARGFRFWAEGTNGRLEMGEEGAAGDWTLHASLPRPARLRLLRDGQEVAALDAPALVRPAEGPGVYRIEATRRARGRERTWVISNPIYLR